MTAISDRILIMEHWALQRGRSEWTLDGDC